MIAGQLDIFHQPQPEPVEVDVPAAQTWSQLTELPGETWQEIFEKKDAT